MRVEVKLADDNGQPYGALIRRGTAADRRHLVRTWIPVLDRGPKHWLDREWPWGTFGEGEEAELAFPSSNPEWLVLADEVAPDARGDLLGVLVTTAPVTAVDAALADGGAASAAMLWVEYIANAPSLRGRDCPPQYRRAPFLKGVGVRLMLEAIKRSERMGFGGRVGLHAEGTVAYDTYRTRWGMRELGNAEHPAGGDYPVFFGDTSWASGYRTAYE